MFPHEEINRMEAADRMARAARVRSAHSVRVAAMRRRPRQRLARLLDVLRPGSLNGRRPEAAR
jgi:hypothetical protein